jgi:glycerophosphoryl diester phosphodiesterase
LIVALRRVITGSSHQQVTAARTAGERFRHRRVSDQSLLVPSGCPSGMVDRQGISRRPVTVGHRGASALAPENTLCAFELAIEHGLDMVELDVHLSRDEQLVVIHDADLAAVAGRLTCVADLTAAELADVDVGNGQGVPRLVDVLDLARGRLGVYVELKGAGTGSALGALVKAGAAAGVELIGGSFEPALVAQLRASAPTVPRSVLFRHSSPAAMIAVCRSVGATYAHACFRPIHQDLVWELHGAGLLVMTPHTNDAAEARWFASLEVDVIASDSPYVLAGLGQRSVRSRHDPLPQ